LEGDVDCTLSSGFGTTPYNDVPSGAPITYSVFSVSDGNYKWSISCTDVAGNVGNSVEQSYTIDKTAPKISSVYTTAPNTVEVTFDEDLLNNESGHHPSISDFEAYNDSDNSLSLTEGETPYGIGPVSYSNKVVIITLTNPIQAGDHPRLYVTPVAFEPSTLIDLAENYFNDGAGYDTSIDEVPVTPVVAPAPTTGGGGGGSSGGRHRDISNLLGGGEVLGASTSIYGNSSGGTDLQRRLLALMLQLLDLLQKYQVSLH
jgi:hypothetical protein